MKIIVYRVECKVCGYGPNRCNCPNRTRPCASDDWTCQFKTARHMSKFPGPDPNLVCGALNPPSKDWLEEYSDNFQLLKLDTEILDVDPDGQVIFYKTDCNILETIELTNG